MSSACRRRLELNQLYLPLISALIVCESRNKNRITISPCKPHKWINDQKPSQATYYYLGQSIATTKNWEPAGFQWHSSPDILVAIITVFYILFQRDPANTHNRLLTRTYKYPTHTHSPYFVIDRCSINAIRENQKQKQPMETINLGIN